MKCQFCQHFHNSDINELAILQIENDILKIQEEASSYTPDLSNKRLLSKEEKYMLSLQLVQVHTKHLSEIKKEKHGICTRFPQTVPKNKTEFCGEFKAQ